jgi:hypothetical protein
MFRVVFDLTVQSDLNVGFSAWLFGYFDIINARNYRGVKLDLIYISRNTICILQSWGMVKKYGGC